MVCKNCGSILKEGAAVCGQCGAEIHPAARSGASGRRQGRPDAPRVSRAGSALSLEDAPLMPDAVMTNRRRPRSEGAGRPSARRGTPPPPTTGRQMRRPGRENAHTVRRMMVNWALVWTIAAVLLIVGAAGSYLFLKMTDQGQLILARMGQDVNAQALWTYGQELLDMGYVEKSIATFEKAYAQEPEREDIYARLEQLADAYEAGGRAGDAEKIYTQLYTEIDPKNPAAYRAVVRLMQDQNRRLELADFLKQAYEATGDTSFRRQREELIPSTPTSSLEAGTLLRERDVELCSAEDYDIYYLLGEEGSLPEDGTHYETPVHLGEGSHILRAVAVSNDLISDELNVKYTITLPSPSAPVSSLAPGTYERRQRIWLRYVESDEEKASKDEKQKDITIYYTIDGQTPSSNSPIFTGDPFYLPNGSVTVKAVAVNGYGKVSNVMERTYKINQTVREKFFRETDEFSQFSLLKTTRDAFEKAFGAPQAEENIEASAVQGNCLKLTYAWGEARFLMDSKGYVLYYLESDSSSLTPPRKTRLGMSAADIIAKFRDLGQTYDQNGDRSLYWDDGVGYGKYYCLSATQARIDYVCYRAEGGSITLRYFLENDRAVRVSIGYATK